MATIKDVARLAGVSTTTVSHVINKTRFVAEATQEKVLEAVNELNYAPSAVARSLKCNSTRTIGMLVTQSTNLFFSEVIDGVVQGGVPALGAGQLLEPGIHHLDHLP